MPARNEWTLLIPWPTTVRYVDTVVERVIQQRMPPRPITPLAYASTGRLCTEARFAEGEIDARLGGGKV